MRAQKIAYLFTALTVLFWGGAASAFKLALAELSPFSLLAYATAISFFFLLILLAAQGRLKELTMLSRKELASSLALGLINPLLYYLVLFKAYALLPGQIAMALNYAWPLVLTLLSVPILGQKLQVYQLVAVAVSFFGAVLIATKGQLTSFGELNGLGLVLALCSTVIWAVFWLVNARDRVDPVLKHQLSFFSALCCVIVMALWQGGVDVPNGKTLLPLIYVGLFEMGLTFVLWLSALQRAQSAASIGNLIYCTPFLSLVFLHFVVGEEIYAATFLGLFLIVGSLLFQEVVRLRVKKLS